MLQIITAFLTDHSVIYSVSIQIQKDSTTFSLLNVCRAAEYPSKFAYQMGMDLFDLHHGQCFSLIAFSIISEVSFSNIRNFWHECTITEKSP